MEPVTGTFMSMDTYSGTLSDPVSLHKYLFANSNPVEYCDPSGYSSLTLTEVVGVCAIIGALSGAFLYDIGFLRNESEPKSLGGYLAYAIIGAIIAVIIFFVIYLIVKLITLIIVWLELRPQDVELIEEGVEEAADDTQRFALGVKEELSAFAERFNAQTYESCPEGTNWTYYVEQMIKDKNVEKFFNLNGIDLNNIEQELRYAELYEKWGISSPDFHWTSWEMYLIKTNGLQDTVRWFLNGVETTSPF